MSQLSLLEQHELQYSGLIAEITIQIGQLRLANDNNGSSDNIKQISERIDSSLQEAHELLEQMNLEIHDLEGISQRSNATSRLNCAQAELKRLQNDYHNTKISLKREVASKSTFSGLDNDVRNLHKQNSSSLDNINNYLCDDDQKQRLLENSELIERAGNRIQEGYRVILETEAIGTQVLNDLYHQRETIQGARGRLRETNAELGRASRTLNNMIFRIWKEKFILYGMIVCFIVAVVISLYLTLSPSSSPTPSNS